MTIGEYDMYVCMYVSYNSFLIDHFIMWKRINDYYIECSELTKALESAVLSMVQCTIKNH